MLVRERRRFFAAVLAAAVLVGAGCLAASRIPLPDGYRLPEKVIIFRVDDAQQGLNEPVLVRIIELFRERGLPVDVGVIPFAGGRPTHELPFLKEYLAAGVVGLSMHGLNHVPREFETARSGKTRAELAAGLRQARRAFAAYYGEEPEAFTVPYDFFDEQGYLAIQDAGFRVFSTYLSVENHPSLAPVDFAGRPDPAGMVRLPRLCDTIRWDTARQAWGEAYDARLGNAFFESLQMGLRRHGLAVLTIHPQALLDGQGRVNPDYLRKLGEVLDLSRTLGRITTFAEWRRRAAAPAGARS